MASATVKLQSGFDIPLVGLGTWQSEPGEVYKAVKDAIAVGYRHIDCAYLYYNQNEVGAAIRDVVQEGKIKTEQLFITSKVWNTFHEYEKAQQNVDENLKQLSLDYLDLCLMHWPFGFVNSDDMDPPKDGSQWFSDTDYLETWKAIEDSQMEGKARSIGVSNFNLEQIDRVLANCRIKPVMNQVACHPYLSHVRLRDACAQRGILLTAYSPLSNPGSAIRKGHEPNVLLEEAALNIAKKHGKSPAQIVLRWNVQRGVVVIPKTVSKARMVENISLFDFELSADEMTQMAQLDRGKDGRMIWHRHVSEHKYWPFRNEY